ncbi:hypothetical protein GQ600_19400 [Phytophthora cactorum]|nr:hypothetical protein GQ600_19400 [Phytophthora cactorum]
MYFRKIAQSTPNFLYDMFIFHSAKLDDAPPKKKKKKKKKRSYTIREKRDAVRRMQEVGVEEVARGLLSARGAVHGWWQQDDKLLRFTGHATSKTMKGQGRKEMFPDVSAIVTFIKDKRCDEVVSRECVFLKLYFVNFV